MAGDTWAVDPSAIIRCLLHISPFQTPKRSSTRSSLCRPSDDLIDHFCSFCSIAVIAPKFEVGVRLEGSTLALRRSWLRANRVAGEFQRWGSKWENISGKAQSQVEAQHRWYPLGRCSVKQEWTKFPCLYNLSTKAFFDSMCFWKHSRPDVSMRVSERNFE